MVRVFANGPGGSISGRVIPKTKKMVLDATLLNTQHYKVRIKGKSGAIQGKELRPPVHPGVVALEKGAFRSPLTMVEYIIYKCYELFLKNPESSTP